MPNTSDEDTSSTFSLEKTRAAAATGNAEAQFALAIFFAARPPEDYPQALEWYRRAADQNHRLAQLNLGQMFAEGQGTSRNDSMALMWIRRSAEGGDAGAQFYLGDRFARQCTHTPAADSVELRIEAYKWFTLAAAQEYRDALQRADYATMRMTREEVTEGNRRVKVFGIL